MSAYNITSEKYPEALYIESKLLNFSNYKKLKIDENDLLNFEDDIITLNVANIYLE